MTTKPVKIPRHLYKSNKSGHINDTNQSFHMSFRGWIYQQRQRPDAIGNMARAICVDRCLVGEGNLQHVTPYIRHFVTVHHATAEDVAVLYAAWSLYREEWPRE